MTKLIKHFNEYCEKLGVDAEQIDKEDLEEVYPRLYAYYILGENDPEALEKCIADIGLKILGVFGNENDDCIEIVVPVEKGEILNASCYLKLKKLAKEEIKKVQNGKSNSALGRLFDATLMIPVKDQEEDRDKTVKVKIVFLVKEREADLTKRDSIKRNLKVHQGRGNYAIDIYFPDELQDKIEEISAPSFVEEGIIHIDAKNWLSYRDSLVVNLKASSLQNLYSSYKNKGLFEQNLRFHVGGKNVDSAILNSARENRGDFWYFNNGINIVCSDYEIKNDREILLKKFSIINGGQTTSVLGEKLRKIQNEDSDFLILCKIIKKPDIENDEELVFVSKLAAAANQQKPIKDCDLIANMPIQRALEKLLDDNGIFYAVKRGKKTPPRFSTPGIEKWRKTNSSDLGTLILSGVGQDPASARLSKKSVFSEKKRKKIFGEDNETILPFKISLYRDLLIIKQFYEEWRDKLLWEEEETQKEGFAIRDGLLQNGMCGMVATFCAFAKCTVGAKWDLIITGKMNDKEEEERINLEKLSSWDAFPNGIFKCPTDTKEAREKLKYECFDLFEKLMDILIAVYHDAKSEKNDLVYSNFFKRAVYHKEVLRKLLREKDKIESFFTKGIQKQLPTKEEMARLRLLRHRFKYSNGKKTKSKARDLTFTNAQAEAIVKKVPELRANNLPFKPQFLNCLQNDIGFSVAQRDFWGEHMISILRDYL